MLDNTDQWRTVSLGSISQIKSGGTPNRKSPEYWDPNGIPWVTTSEVAYGVITTTKERISKTGLANSSAKIFPAGTLLIALYGQGKTRGQVATLGIDAATNQACAAIIPNKSLDRDFLYYSLQNDYARIRGLSNSGGQDNLSAELVREIRIPLPPLPEQRRIAGILRTWDEAIDAASRLIDAKRRRLDGVAARLFASTRAIGGGRRPEGWTRMTFGDAFAERKTRNPGLLDTDVVTVGKYAIRKQSEHFKRSVASKDLSPYWVISPGDFVYDPMSAYYGALGRFDGTSDGVVSPAYRVIRLAKGLDSDFMAELLKQHHVRFQLDALSSQGNKEGKRRSLQRSAFDSVEFFAPGQNAQREMAEKVALFRADLAASETHLDALKRQKRGLMQKLLTGEWRVPA